MADSGGGSGGGSSSAPSDKRPPLLSDERIVAAPGYNRWLQLVPACIAGTAIGTYPAVPAVLGPSICRAQGIVVQVRKGSARVRFPARALDA